MNTNPPVSSRTANVLPFTVPVSIGTSSSTFTTAFRGTPVCPLNGASATTNGANTAGNAPVVKCVVCATTAFPARSCTPATVTVICVLSGKGSCSASTTSWLLLLKKIVCGTCTTPPTLTATLLLVTVSGFTGALNRTRTWAFTGTFTARLVCTLITAFSGTPVKPPDGVAPVITVAAVFGSTVVRNDP